MTLTKTTVTLRALLVAATLTSSLALHAQTAAPAVNAASPAGTANAEYRLGSGDVLRITVYQNPDLTLETRVSEAGVLSFPLLGTVRLGGLSVTNAEKLIGAVTDDGVYTDVEKDTVEYIRTNSKLAEAADDWFRTQISTWAGAK